ncbi:hypothetical protein EJB05_40830 [Eragrostis curvula]|uniref:Uncharacterized protein n=1 Tax=Eragrostis curvula TaxID=38414 RepID=A0A5J9TQH0_9POAL|nr:hypothetical protein EJB05_40830 [Eragrostis curvula]
MAAAAAMAKTLLRSVPAAAAGSTLLRSPVSSRAHGAAGVLLRAKGRVPLASPGSGARRFCSDAESGKDKAIRLAQEIGKMTEKGEAGETVGVLVGDLVKTLKTLEASTPEVTINELAKQVGALSAKVDSLSERQLTNEIKSKINRSVMINCLAIYGAVLIAIPGSWYVLKADMKTLKTSIISRNEAVMSTLEKHKHLVDSHEKDTAKQETASTAPNQETASTAPNQDTVVKPEGQPPVG